MLIPMLTFAIANIVFAMPQSPDSADLAAAILRETVGYATSQSHKVAKGPVLIDVESFQNNLQAVRFSALADSALRRYAGASNAKNAKRSQAVVSSAKAGGVSVIDDGVLVELESVSKTADSARVLFFMTSTIPSPPGVKDYPSRIISQMYQVVFKRSDGRWRLVQRSVVTQS